MTKNFIFGLLSIIAINSFAQSKKPMYDPQLAAKLGADKFGMKTYIMAFLYEGPNRLKDSDAINKLQKAHLNNIRRLAEAGKIIVAGPFLDDQKIKGIFIFNVKTIKEAKMLTETDPAIKSGSLVMELHPWYGSAALIESFKIHKKVEKMNVADSF